MDLNILNNLTNGYSANTYTNIKKDELKTENLQNKLDSAAKNGDEAELRKACTEFESYFLQMMYKEMRKTVHSEGGLFPKSQAEQIFQDMLDEENCKKVAESGNGLGLAEMLYKQLSNQKL